MVAAVTDVSQPEVETRSTGLFQIVTLDWKEGNKWRLDAGQGEFWAEIADHGWLNKVHRHEVVFGEGDVLKAEYVSLSERRKGKIVSTTKLMRILEVIPPSESHEQSAFLPQP